MPIPDYQSFMLPLLKWSADGKEHRLRDAYEVIADQSELSSDERRQLLPSGSQHVYKNRIQWAKVYLTKAKLLDPVRHGVFKITPRGLDLLAKNPLNVDSRMLMQYEEFREYKQPSDSEPATAEEQVPQGGDARTPEEQLEAAYKTLRSTLAEEVLEQVQTASPAFFEKLVVELLVAMGYGGSVEDAGKVLGRSGDEGIDGIIKEDRLGLDIIYVQAKRWQAVVGRPEIQRFVGALQGQRARKGVFLTTSSFTREAQAYAAGIDSKIVLIDGERLAQHMMDFGVGVSSVRTITMKRLDSDYCPSMGGSEALAFRRHLKVHSFAWRTTVHQHIRVLTSSTTLCGQRSIGNRF